MKDECQYRCPWCKFVFFKTYRMQYCECKRTYVDWGGSVKSDLIRYSIPIEQKKWDLMGLDACLKDEEGQLKFIQEKMNDPEFKDWAKEYFQRYNDVKDLEKEREMVKAFNTFSND